MPARDGGVMGSLSSSDLIGWNIHILLCPIQEEGDCPTKILQSLTSEMSFMIVAETSVVIHYHMIS